MARTVSASTATIFATSCEVRKPSKKWITGMRPASVAACAISAKSCASCGELAASMAQPVARQAMTSDWSPKIDSACVASVRAATCSTKGVSSPAILYRLGIISSRPWLAVKLVASAPEVSAPCSAPAAPPSDCISMIFGTAPHRLGLPCDAHSSAHSPMLDAGVMG